jgi:iron complex outermembrane receptor protein
MMRTFILLLAILFLIFIKSSAQNSIRGSVTDKLTGKPLIASSVYIHDLNRGASTDTSGNYSIKNLPSGKFLIEVKYLGYTTQTMMVEINGEGVQNFILQEAVTEIEPVIVTGVSSATVAKNSPIPITRVSKEALLQNSSTNIVDAISKQPGISQVSTGAAISKPIIRGMGYNRVISLYNGVRQEGQQWGDEHGIEIGEYSIDRVEIIKGPGSLLYGSDGIGGVVNFLSPKPLQEGEIKGNILTNYQSNNNLIGYSAMNSGNIKKIEWLARVSSKHAGNYTNAYDGKVYNSGFKEFDYNGYLGTTRKWGFSQIHFSNFSQRIAMSEGNRDSLGNFIKSVIKDDSVTQETVTERDLKGYRINIPNQFIRHSRIYWTNNIQFLNSSLRFTLGYQLNRRQEFGNVLNPHQYGLYFYLPTYNYDIKYFLSDYKDWKTTGGINGMYQHNQNKGIEFLVPDYSLFDIGVFVFTKRKFDRLNIAGGFRLDYRSISTKNLYIGSDGLPTSSNDLSAFHKFSSFSNDYKNYSGSIGITYDITEKLSLKANVSRGFRAPNVAELGSNGRHEGTFRYEYGNANLKAETSLQFDGGISYISQHITLDASIFNNEIQHYIYAVKLLNKSGKDSIVDPAEPVPVYQYGQNNAVLSGGEFVIDVHPHPFDWLHFENAFSIVRGRNKNLPDSGKYLPFMPAPRYQGKLKANLKKAGDRISNFYILAELDHFFRQLQYLKENNTETPTPSYTLVNSGIGGDYIDKKGTVLFSVYFSVNNIFNLAYQNHLSRLKYAPVNIASGRIGIFNMGRNFSIKVVLPFALTRDTKRNKK